MWFVYVYADSILLFKYEMKYANKYVVFEKSKYNKMDNPLPISAPLHSTKLNIIVFFKRANSFEPGR